MQSFNFKWRAQLSQVAVYVAGKHLQISTRSSIISHYSNSRIRMAPVFLIKSGTGINWFSCIIVHALIALASLMPANAGTNTAPVNKHIIQGIAKMPHGGGYALSRHATSQFRNAVRYSDSGLKISPIMAQPSYCSSATYLVFLLTIHALVNEGTIQLSAEDWKALTYLQQPDGHGIWGRWNANGPGVARLFHTQGLGRNFTDLSQAQPGDFLKIFWRDAVGKHEFGHLVIFLGTTKKDGQSAIRFWSSNKPHGYSEKTVPLSQIAHLLFSRFEHPSRLQGIANMSAVDSYLAGLLNKSSSFQEACQLSNAIKY